jgi:polysaccharide pyruvyl transferase CsaB
MKIGIIGNYGATNIGDDAILTAILKSLEGHKVTIFSANPDEWKATVDTKSAPLFPLGFRSYWKYGFLRSIKAMRKLDAVILGGGGLFQDSYLYACFLWAWQIFWIKRFKKPLFIYATGVGPLKSRLGKKLTRWAYRQADVITVRDSYSARILEDLNIGKEVQITADPVFNYRKPNITKGRTKHLYMVSLRPWLTYNKRIVSVFRNVLEKLKEQKEAEFIFVSMQQIKEQDLQMIEPIISSLGGEIYIPNNFSDLLQVMETAEFAIGMRYHFMIAAILTETPVLPITYGPKTEALFEGTPMKVYVNPVDKLTEEALMTDLKKLSVGYNNATIYQKVMTGEYAELADKNSEMLKEFLKKVDPSQKDW